MKMEIPEEWYRNKIAQLGDTGDAIMIGPGFTELKQKAQEILAKQELDRFGIPITSDADLEELVDMDDKEFEAFQAFVMDPIRVCYFDDNASIAEKKVAFEKFNNDKAELHTERTDDQAEI